MMPLSVTKHPKQLVLPSTLVKPPPVLTKFDFVQRYNNGEFGNASPTWQTLEEFIRAKRAGYELVHIRNRVAGARTWYNIRADQVGQTAHAIVLGEEATWENVYYSLMCPTHLTTIQGELMVDRFGHWQLYYSNVAKPMRQSLIEGGKQVGHLQAKCLIERYMNARSLSWLNWLLWAYPNHVIEFTCLSRCWGTRVGENTLFWEIRNY